TKTIQLTFSFKISKPASFEANVDFSQSSLSKRGNPNVERFGWRGCLSPSGESRRTSSAATELAKNLWRFPIER
ncbi:MAG: hypothetical protein ABIC18_01945, partial [Candidatus Omnitrophota bacterium]